MELPDLLAAVRFAGPADAELPPASVLVADSADVMGVVFERGLRVNADILVNSPGDAPSSRIALVNRQLRSG